jgi:hypothetical protein
MRGSNTYRFSFTAASLMLNELILYAKQIVDNEILIENLTADVMNRERSKTNKREFAELLIRLKTLSPKELVILSNGTYDDQKLIAFVAFSRAYSIFRDFINEVILEKITLYDYVITDRDYNSFISRKSIDHDELNDLADSTKAKIKQVMFKVLHQAGLIDNIKKRSIIIPIVGLSLEKSIAETNLLDLKLLLYTEDKILNLCQ